MPMIIEGYVAVSTRKLSDHIGHTLGTDGTRIFCERDRDEAGLPVELEREYKSTSLPCGCSDKAEHDEGVRLQNDMRRQYPRELRNPAICVGCYLGDDGPSMHSCVIHQF